jgi:hypothetical protein
VPSIVDHKFTSASGGVAQKLGVDVALFRVWKHEQCTS